VCRRTAEAKAAAVLVGLFVRSSPLRRRAAYTSFSRFDVADLSTTIATRKEFEVKERQSGLDAVGDRQG
jgi:hypothetical protein